MQIRSRGKPGSRSSRTVVIMVTPDSQRHSEAGHVLEFRQTTMRQLLLNLSPVLLLLSQINAEGIGKAWQVLPHTSHWNHPSWPRLDSSAFEVRSVSGVGHITTQETSQKPTNPIELNSIPSSKPFTPIQPFQDHFEPIFQDLPHSNPNQNNNEETHANILLKKVLEPQSIMIKILQPRDDTDFHKEPQDDEIEGTVPRVRRDADNETKLEQITSTKNVRDVRQSSPQTWSSQPLSIDFPQRSTLDQMIQQTNEDEDPPNSRGYHAPRADFVTSHHRRSYDHREARDMPVTRGYEDYDLPWYRNSIRDRDYDPLSYRRGFSYYYPDRYRMERDYYSTRGPNDYSYYYDRYRDDMDMDLYGRSRPTPKPKRIIYYATLPEVVRKPVDLRNYPRTYDGTRSQVSRDGSFKRIPGNVDPSRYRYRQLYDGYDSYSKRSSIAERPYGYAEEDGKRNRVTLESFRNGDGFDQNNERKLANQISVRNDGKLPWPVQVGTEVSVKDDDRVPGRKIFGDSDGFERFQSVQMQKAPDATGSSELQSDN